MQLTLLVPEFSLPAEEVSPLAIHTIFSMGDHKLNTPQQNYDQILSSLFGMVSSPSLGIPVAALTALIDFPESNKKHWLRADPVYLRADLNKLVLFDGRSLMLDHTEAQSLIKTINQFLQEDGLTIRMGCDPQRWLIALDAPVDLLTFNPAEISGHDAGPWRMKGIGSDYWLRLGNELQMLLHDHPVNQAREQQGKPPVNSLWFWGTGVLPEQNSNKPCWDQVYTDEVTGRGLAAWLGVNRKRLPNDLSELWGNHQATDETLIILSENEDLNSLEDRWFQPLLQAVKHKRVDRLQILSNQFRLTLTGKDLWRFWRRWRSKQ